MLYLVISLWLFVYGANAFVFVALYLRHKQHTAGRAVLSEWPAVTIQLPVYNERYVVTRAIDAVVGQNWPRNRLQVQVLDDSTDETTGIIEEHIEPYRRQGIDISLSHRTSRDGFKAGAMNAAMDRAKGAFIAVFDADFSPAPDFLRRTVPLLIADPGLGFVQARWGHMNDKFSLLTLAQAIALDGHFVVEHTARGNAGLLTSFNGTAGVWRRECIEETGGWDASQLTEDVDLSYRAQLDGWRGLTLQDVVAPAELPVQFAAFKQQQFRWAKGNLQCFLKLAGSIIRARLPVLTRVQACLHLSYYFAHVLMLVVMLATLPLIWYRLLDQWTLAFLGVASLGLPLLYGIGQRALYGDWRKRLRGLPVLICLGVGLALNSTAAALEAFLGVRSSFQRTPKYRIEGRQGVWRGRSYAIPIGNLLWGEILLTVYALLTVFAATQRGHLSAIPFLLLYVLGFGLVSVLGVIESVKRSESSSQVAQAMGGECTRERAEGTEPSR
jgi:cellulose synthase/poly-beta-1,6-N-acetylglucosamine synthase-like glycosyltransferase